MLEQPAAILSRTGGIESDASAVLFIGGCLGYCDTPSTIAALRSQIRNEHTDWVRIVNHANRNRVTPALWLGLKRKGLTNCLPDDVSSYLTMIYDLNRKRNQTILAQALEAVAALNHCGIQPVFMKGCLTLLEGTLDIGSSILADIDIIVKEDEISEAFTALRSLGYITLGAPAAHAHAWTFHRSMSLVTIDLHRDVGPQRSILPPEIAIREAIAVTGNTARFRGLSITHRVFLLIMSFGIFERHFYARDIPLRNLHYLAALCHRYSGEIDWQLVASTVTAHRLTTEAAAWGLLARCFLDAPIPSDLYWGTRAHAHLMRSLLQLSRPRLDLASRRYAAVAWPLNRFRMDYRYGCGTGGFRLQAARIRHAVGILVRQSSDLFQHQLVKPETVRATGGLE